jgi:hypothetical protein
LLTGLLIAAVIATVAVMWFAGSAAVGPGVAEAADRPSTAAGRCRTLRYGGDEYVFYEHRVRCHWAKRKAKRLHRSGGRRGEPSRFDCQSTSNFRTNGRCDGPGNKFFGWYPPH